MITKIIIEQFYTKSYFKVSKPSNEQIWSCLLFSPIFYLKNAKLSLFCAVSFYTNKKVVSGPMDLYRVDKKERKK